MALKKGEVDKLKWEGENPTTPVWLFCDAIPGFGVRCSSTGSKAFVFRYSWGGKRPVETLGKVGALAFEEAQAMARKAYAALQRGEDPFPKKPATKDMTVAEFFAMYWERHGSKKRSSRDDKSRIDAHIVPALGDMPVKALNSDAVGRLVSRIGDGAPYQANRVRALISSSWKIGQWKWHVIPRDIPNPTLGVDKFPEVARKRYVKPYEMPHLLRAIDAESDPFMRALFWMLLFTPNRKGQVMATRWEWVDLRDKTIDYPGSVTKNKKEQLVYLSGAAYELLKKLPRPIDNPHVFAGDVPGQPIKETKRAWDRIKTKAALYFIAQNKIEDAAEKAQTIEKFMEITIHDIRRTGSNWMRKAGVAGQTITAILAHSDSSVTEKHYTDVDEEDQRAALELHAVNLLKHKA